MLYFASYRERTGISEEEILLPGGATVEDLKETVKNLHEQLRPVRRMLISVNGEFPEEGAEIKEGDVVALFPPVSGG